MSIKGELANQIHINKEASESYTLAPLIQALVHGRNCWGQKKRKKKKTLKGPLD